MVPTLILDDAPHPESAALALILAERHPEGGLEAPRGAPERPDHLQWMFYFATRFNRSIAPGPTPTRSGEPRRAAPSQVIFIRTPPMVSLVAPAAEILLSG
jgi:glutathione S-transferase